MSLVNTMAACTLYRGDHVVAAMAAVDARSHPQGQCQGHAKENQRQTTQGSYQTQSSA